jgi:hypothetical protein
MRATRTQREYEEDDYEISSVQRIYGKSGTCYTVPPHGSILYSSTELDYVFLSHKGQLVLIIEEEEIEAFVYDLEYIRV